MKKKKLKAEIKKLRAQVIEARTSAVAMAIAKMLTAAAGVEVEALREPGAGEPAIIGKLRRMAEAAAKGKPEL